MNLSTYNQLSFTTFSIAFENINREVIFPRFHNDIEIAKENKNFETNLNKFIELVKSLKKGRDWWNTCSSLRDQGFHSEVNEALSLVS